MYWLFLIIIIVVGNQVIYRHNKSNKIRESKNNLISYNTAFMAVFTIGILYLAYFTIPVFLSPTKDVIETRQLSPMSIRRHINGQPDYIGQTHRRGDDSIIYFVVEKDGNIHQKLVPEDQVEVIERKNIGLEPISPKSTKRPSKKSLPYVETIYKQYKDTWVNRYIFVNSNKRLTGKDSMVGVKLYLPDDSIKIKYVLDY